MGIKVGIDLGTTFCAVAMMDENKGQPVIIPNTDGENITPSVIQFTEDGEIIVGTEAKEAYEIGESGCTSTFKRDMGKEGNYCSFYGKSYTSIDLSAILLRHLKEEAEKVTGQVIEEAVVTVPAYFYSKERTATMQAARMAGLNIRQIINEPTAAAINYGTNHWRENAVIMVYDLGGGTFDVTLVQMKQDNQMVTLSTTGDHTLGGKDWDARICGILEERIVEETAMDVTEYPEIRKVTMQNAENIKKQLTNRMSVNASFYIPEYGKFSTTVSLEEFENSTRDLIEKTGTLCESVLAEMQMGWEDVTDVLLVGGSTRMKQVSAYLKKKSGHTPLSQVNPDEAVALGAAVQVHLPLPEYSVVSIAPPKKQDTSTSRKGLGSFHFRKRPQENSGKKNQSPVKHYQVTGTVGQEVSFDNALCMSHIDVVAHAMGVIAVNTEGNRYINKTIIPANQPIPVKCAEAFHYYTQSRKENELEIYVLQGEDEPLNCQIVGKYVVSGIRHDRQHNPTVIRIQYSYDLNGVVHVQARQESDTVDLPIREDPVPADMSQYGIPIEQEEIEMSPEPLSVVMAVDVSGSMSGSPMDDALQAMCNFADQFSDYPGDVQIGVIAVSDESRIVQNLTSDLACCKRMIRSIQPCMTGICNAGHPFSDIMSMLDYEDGKRVAIVLADGMWDKPSTAIKQAKKCHNKDINIVGIGFGTADKEFLDAISYGDLDAMMVEQSELVHSFGKIAQEIGSDQNRTKHGKSGEDSDTATWEAPDEQ